MCVGPTACWGVTLGWVPGDVSTSQLRHKSLHWGCVTWHVGTLKLALIQKKNIENILPSTKKTPTFLISLLLHKLLLSLGASRLYTLWTLLQGKQSAAISPKYYMSLKPSRCLAALTELIYYIFKMWLKISFYFSNHRCSWLILFEDIRQRSCDVRYKPKYVHKYNTE